MIELKYELATLAARHIAEEGLSYGQAKRKAAKQAGIAETSAAMPDNPIIEAALREYQAQYQADTQPFELLRLRQLALRWIDALTALPELDAPCKVLVTGAVANGTAGELSALHLSVYTDELKHLEMALLNAGFDIQASEQKEAGQVRPLLVLEDQGTPIVLLVLPTQLYTAPKPTALNAYLQKASAKQLRELIA